MHACKTIWPHMYNRYSDTRSSMAPKRENELTLEVLCRQERMITQMTFAQTVLLYIWYSAEPWLLPLARPRAVIGQVSEWLARETCIAKSTFRYLQFLVCGGPEYVKGCWFLGYVECEFGYFQVSLLHAY